MKRVQRVLCCIITTKFYFSVLTKLQDVSITEKKSAVAGSHEVSIPEGTIAREVFSVHEGRNLVRLVLIEDYAVYSKVLVRDERVIEDDLARRFRGVRGRVEWVALGRAPSPLISAKEELLVCKEVLG